MLQNTNPHLQISEYQTQSKDSKTFPELSSSSNPKNWIYHGVDNAITTVLLSSYNKQTTQQQQNKTNTHTHTRDPRRRQTSHDWSQHENNGELFQLIRTFMKKVSVWEETKISVTRANRLKLKCSQVTFTVTASEFKTFWMKMLTARVKTS